MATISVVDNFLSGMSKPDGFKSSAYKNLELFLDVGTFLQLPNCRFLSFKQNGDQYDDEDLILSIRQILKPSQDRTLNWHVQSGNFVGFIQANGHSIEIKPRFSELFLQRMLQAVNNVYLADFDDAQIRSIDYAQFLLYSLFIQKLEKAFLLGLPKVYQVKQYHEPSFKGGVDIAGMTKRDMPYKGKLSSQQRVRTVDEAIISVLNTAVKRVFHEYKQAAQNIRHVSTALRHLNPKKLQKETMSNALSSKALSNPIFAPYKQVLSLAKLIIDQQSVKPAKTDKTESYGFLVNVAELFELYVKSLLQKSFPDWSVDSPKIKR